MPRELTREEKHWCLDQAIAILKDVGHGGQSNMRDAAIVLENLYQMLSRLRQATNEETTS